MTYSKTLHFVYVSLLTIGHGDPSPKSSAGRAFLALWSLVAVPTMTILVWLVVDDGNGVSVGSETLTLALVVFVLSCSLASNLAWVSTCFLSPVRIWPIHAQMYERSHAASCEPWNSVKGAMKANLDAVSWRADTN